MCGGIFIRIGLWAPNAATSMRIGPVETVQCIVGRAERFMNGLSGWNNALCSERLTFPYRTEELKGGETTPPPSPPPGAWYRKWQKGPPSQPFACVSVCVCPLWVYVILRFSLLINALLWWGDTACNTFPGESLCDLATFQGYHLQFRSFIGVFQIFRFVICEESRERSKADLLLLGICRILIVFVSHAVFGLESDFHSRNRLHYFSTICIFQLHKTHDLRC